MAGKGRKRQAQDASFVLSDQACDEIAARITEFCAAGKIERKEALRYRLSAEECLLYWLANGCEGKTVRLRMGSRMLAPFILLEAEGGPLDPYRGSAEDYGPYCGGVLSNLRLAPEYSYDGGCNRLLFRLHRKKPGQITLLAFVIVLAALVGSLGMAVLPAQVRETLQSGIVVPIYDTFFHILSCVAGPMIFLAVAWGIYGIGDAATLGRIGKRLMLRYLGMTFLAAACGAVCFPLFGNSLTQTAGQGSQLAAITQLILGIFPATVIEPFATGNTLQIIFLAIVIGIALLFLGRKTSAVARAVEQVNYLVQFLMELISRLVPFVIFLVIVNLIWSGDLAILSSIWQLLLIFLGAAAVTAAAFLLSVSIRYKVRPLTLLRKNSGTFLIALATASSAAAFSSNMSTCEKKLGVESSLCSFGIPLGMVIHKPFTAIYNLLLIFYFASRYGVACSATWIILAVVVSAIVAVATPPIPGGGAVAYAILFAQMGIPAEAMAVALTIDMLTDFAITAFEMFTIPFSLIHTAGRLGMIDPDTLRTE